MTSCAVTRVASNTTTQRVRTTNVFMAAQFSRESHQGKRFRPAQLRTQKPCHPDQRKGICSSAFGWSNAATLRRYTTGPSGYDSNRAGRSMNPMDCRGVLPERIHNPQSVHLPRELHVLGIQHSTPRLLRRAQYQSVPKGKAV